MRDSEECLELERAIALLEVIAKGGHTASPVAVRDLIELGTSIPESREGEVWDTLSELAYDLDYFEPDPRIRRQDASYFGYEQLQWIAQQALQKLRASDLAVEVS